MMNRFYFIYLLYFWIYLMIVYSDDDENTNVFDEIRREKLIERFTTLHRIRRNGPTNTTLFTYPTASSTNLPTTTVTPTTYSMTNRTSNISSTYIVTSFTTPGTTTRSTQFINQTSSTTTYSVPTTTRASTPSYTTSLYNPDTCYISGFVKLVNGTCITKPVAQTIAASILRNTSANVTDTANALSLYISSITNATTLSNKTNTLSVEEIDNIVDDLYGVNLTINSNTSFLMIQQPEGNNNEIVLGASFTRGIGGEIIDTSNQENITNSFLSAACMVSKESLVGVISLNFLIIDKPTGYENADNSTNKTLASSVIVANMRRNSSIYPSINISLYYRPIDEYKQNDTGKYLCSFYDTNNSQWNESGCSDPFHNTDFNRYECNCTHLTSFALIWLPQSLLTTNYTKIFDAQNIASIIFQSISIACFLAVMIHAIGLRMINPLMRLQPLKLLPLISTATTTILFIFFIALGLTAYTQTSSSDETECFLSSSILMFITYFLLIYMFCVKTSTGYFYYLRFVHLRPPASHRPLLLMLIISFLIALLCVILAIGFNTKSTYNITQLYPYQLCWFTRDVIYYFLTIPIGIFLLLNIIIITLVSRSIITHAFHATTRQQINGRLKRCVLVLLSSCVTQGIAWLFGPFISFLNPIAGNILAWFFIILNGLEGFWTIILYLLIRSKQLNEKKHISTIFKFAKTVGISSNKEEKLNNKENDLEIVEKNKGKEQLYSFNDLRKKETNGSDDYDDKVSH